MFGVMGFAVAQLGNVTFLAFCGNCLAVFVFGLSFRADLAIVLRTGGVLNE